MAIMVPEAVDSTCASPAERRLFNRFRAEVSNEWYVLHSLDIVRHPKKLIGETDFVLIGPSGVFFVEVKGGRVACEDGMWIFTNRHDSITRKHQSPWRQAATGLLQVRSEIERNNGWQGLNFGYGVIIPDDVFTSTGPEIEHEVLWDNRDWTHPLEEYIAKLARYWTTKNFGAYGRQPKALDRADTRKIRMLLRPDVKSVLTLSSELNSIESEQVELTEEQSRAVRGMSRNPRSIVFGGAGTGKTLLALEEANRLADCGSRVLVLCYNQLLGRHLEDNKQHENILATSVHEFFRQEIKKQPGIHDQLNAAMTNGENDDFYRRVYPDLFMDAIVSADHFEPFDVLILDEAQDLMNDHFISAFDLALQRGIADGQWHMFLDPNQDIYGAHSQRALDDLLSYGVGQYDLTINCRNSQKVAVNASVLSQYDVPLHRAVEGGFERTIYFFDGDELAKKLNALVQELLDGGAHKSDMIFLAPKRLSNSILIELKLAFPINDITESRQRKRGSIDFCTMQAFKGLERRLVIATDLECIETRLKQPLLYCGLTRARAGLVCCIHDRHKQDHHYLAEQFGKRLPAILARD